MSKSAAQLLYAPVLVFSLSHMVRHEVLKTGKLKKIMGDIFYKIIFVFLEVGFEIQFFV